MSVRLAASVGISVGEIAAPPTTACWKCRGSGLKLVRSAVPGVPVSVTCPICKGDASARAPRVRRAVNAEVEFPGWQPIGPAPDTSAVARAKNDLEDGETLSYLTGQWRIVQAQSHRYSTDDVVTAYLAHRIARVIETAFAPDATAPYKAALRVVDLGCGIGSVLLMSAWLYPSATCIGVEAQASRACMARRSVALNGLTDRVTIVNGDLREASMLVGIGRADIVTGTPPYFKVGPGALPAGALPASNEETARCLFEYRGGVEAYCAAATPLLSSPSGVFIFVMSAIQVQRSYAAVAAAGMRVLARLDIIPVAGKPPLLNVFACCIDTLDAREFFRLPARGGPECHEDGVAVDAAATLSHDVHLPRPPTPLIRASDLVPDGISPYVSDDTSLRNSVCSSQYHDGSTAVLSAMPPATRATDCNSVAVGNDSQVRRSRAAHRAAAVARYPRGGADGEAWHALTVREASGNRTREYCLLLRELGKPG